MTGDLNLGLTPSYILPAAAMIIKDNIHSHISGAFHYFISWEEAKNTIYTLPSQHSLFMSPLSAWGGCHFQPPQILNHSCNQISIFMGQQSTLPSGLRLSYSLPPPSAPSSKVQKRCGGWRLQALLGGHPSQQDILNMRRIWWSVWAAVKLLNVLLFWSVEKKIACQLLRSLVKSYIWQLC